MYLLTSFLLLFATTNCLSNPGILLQIPNQLSLPQISIQLPIQIPPIVASSLQLTNVSLRQIEYNWKISSNQFIINLPKWLIAFQWTYKKDRGFGTFQQTYLQLDVDWQPSMSSNNRFQIQIVKAKIKSDEFKSKFKVHLGGGISETVLVEVTDLILNHARVVFRKIVTNALIGVIQSLSDVLKTDPSIYCPQQNNCIKLNTSLIAKPFRYQNQLLIQVNSAAYRTNTSSGDLNPSSAMFKIPSTNNIVIQLHQDVLNRAFTVYNSIKPIILQIKSTQISSITQIHTQTLSMIFPQMKKQTKPLPVIFTIALDTLTMETGVKQLSANVGAHVAIFIERQSQRQTYIQNIQGKAKINVKFIYKGQRISLRISSVQLSDLTYDQKDLIAGLIIPEQFQKHISTLMKWASGAINGSLNQKIAELLFKDAGVNIENIYYEQNSFAFQVKFASKQIKQSEKSDIQLISY